MEANIILYIIRLAKVTETFATKNHEDTDQILNITHQTNTAVTTIWSCYLHWVNYPLQWKTKTASVFKRSTKYTRCIFSDYGLLDLQTFCELAANL